MKYFVEKSGSKIVAKGCISEDVELNPNQIEVTEKEYNNIKFDTVAERQQELEQTEEEKINFDDIKKEFNNEVQQIRNSINGITKKIEDNSRLETIEIKINDLSDTLNQYIELLKDKTKNFADKNEVTKQLGELIESIETIKKQQNNIITELEENAQHKKCINESIINIEQRLKLMDSLVDKKEINEIVNKLTNEVNVIKEYQNNAKSESEENKSRLEKIENVISEMTKEPELTEREKINAQVVAKIRERYSIDEEFKMHRLGLQDQKNIEYLKYLNYVQQCIDWGNNEKKKLELGIEE